MTTEGTNLLIRDARGFLHVGNGVQNTAASISLEDSVLKVSISENSDCVVIIPANTSFSFEVGSVFQGHDISGLSVHNGNGQIAQLIYNQNFDGLDLQLSGDHPNYGVYIVDA